MAQEKQILDAALKALEREADIHGRVHKLEADIGDMRVDAIIELAAKPKIQFNAEVKRWAQHKEFGALVYQVKQIPNALLVADYINPKMAERLRDENIEFIDCAGNAFINKEALKIWVRGNAKPNLQALELEFTNEKPIYAGTQGGKIFAATGLRVIYQFLLDPELLNAPYRKIAEKAGVALGNIGWLMRDLIAERYITQKGQGRNAQRRLRNYKGLLQGFTENYPRNLKPKQDLGTFYTTEPRWYLDIDITEFKGLWGGEYAAGQQTNYLKAQDGLIYLCDRTLLPALVAAGKLRGGQQPEGNPGKVQIIKAFWGEAYPQTYEEYTDPVLTYADLIATGDVRNSEAADIIWEQELKGRAEFND
ncbi:MAG: hypothetical protein HOM20_08030 [Porticoccaceae bacterium]|jgi:hypothetical protein|nr:hypothetical protein [Porticoccaceae bacterium]